MKVGIQARLKNGILWEAAKNLGSVVALAEYLGMSYPTINEWINFKRCPEMTGWRYEKYNQEAERKLFELTGHTFEEIFPPEIRGKEFQKRQKRIDAVVEMPVQQLVAAGAMPQLTPAPDELLFQKEANATIDHLLRELRPREAEVIKMRFGLDGEREHTLEELTSHFHLTKERIRQLEIKALGRLRHPARSRPVSRTLGSESEVILGDYYPEPHKFPKHDEGKQ